MTNLLADMNVSGDLAALLLDYLAANGLHLPELERELRQFPPASRMRFRQWWRLLDTLQQQLPGHLVGMELGQAIKPAYVGVLGYLTLSCDTVAEALQRFQRYQRLLHDGDTAHFDLRGDQACLCWRNQYGPSTQLSDEVLVMGMVANLRSMTDCRELQPTRIHFVGPRPDHAAAYQSFVQCDIAFDQPQLELIFPMEYLQWPVTHSDPALKQLLEQQAQTLLSVLPRQEDFHHRLQQAILKAIQSGEPTLDAVAKTLALSRRTLHRRLHERGLVFKDLLQEIRLQLARQYLAERRLTLAEIGLLLGYSEQSAFTRAFRQWSGTTPLQYQKRQQQGASVKGKLLP
ncbi:MAG: AraC family transcriptional regulator ligand-binding domain-containing protein [Pseudomonadota bacterium]|nr:AraC family transcriptional regulator ligand-binding domain-containing protein [Pseudomonadota bacterium]